MFAPDAAQVVRRRADIGTYNYEARNPETVDGTVYHAVTMFGYSLSVRAHGQPCTPARKTLFPHPDMITTPTS